MMQRFEAIYLRNLTNNKDYQTMIDIDVSKNSLTETSIKYLADIIRKFQGFRSMNLSNLSKMKEIGFIELAKSLKENYSIQKLDLSNNSLSQNILNELYAALAENYVISELKIDFKGKTMPFGFSNYILMSMYQVFLTRENIFL